MLPEFLKEIAGLAYLVYELHLVLLDGGVDDGGGCGHAHFGGGYGVRGHSCDL